jgi:hypothetical protein
MNPWFPYPLIWLQLQFDILLAVDLLLSQQWHVILLCREWIMPEAEIFAEFEANTVQGQPMTINGWILMGNSVMRVPVTYSVGKRCDMVKGTSTGGGTYKSVSLSLCSSVTADVAGTMRVM